MKKRAVSMLLTAVMAVTGMAATATVAHAEGEEGKVINIYSWNDEFRTRLEAIYPEVESTSSDGTVTTLKDGTEIHWIINPNQDGVYQQKLDEALLNQADASDDDKIAAEKFLAGLGDICRVCEVPTLEEYGIDKEKFFSLADKMADDALASGSPGNTIKKVTKQDVLDIYFQLW